MKELVGTLLFSYQDPVTGTRITIYRYHLDEDVVAFHGIE